MTQMKTDDLVAFESEIASLFGEGKIKAPIHLRSGCEENLIQIFEGIKKDDWVFGYWGMHLHCLLKGVPQDKLKKSILDGDSIALCFPEERIYCSGIVGSQAGVAVGAAYGIKERKSSEHVYLFTGDMGAECGIFHEAVKFSFNHKLPITFVVEDNGISVLTDTREVWGDNAPWFKDTKYEKIIKYFKYKNGWPHSGIGKRIAF
jgi:TPP-dependent pyruvate/acetoin dehydrogenase alpha subunit